MTFLAWGFFLRHSWQTHNEGVTLSSHCVMSLLTTPLPPPVFFFFWFSGKKTGSFWLSTNEHRHRHVAHSLISSNKGDGPGRGQWEERMAATTKPSTQQWSQWRVQVFCLLVFTALSSPFPHIHGPVFVFGTFQGWIPVPLPRQGLIFTLLLSSLLSFLETFLCVACGPLRCSASTLCLSWGGHTGDDTQPLCKVLWFKTCYTRAGQSLFDLWMVTF